MRYEVYEKADPGYDEDGLLINYGDTWRLAFSGDTDRLNENFPPLREHEGSYIPQLERIRWDASRRSERGMEQGDLILLGKGWWLYTSHPPQGGFSYVEWEWSLQRIEAGIERGRGDPLPSEGDRG